MKKGHYIAIILVSLLLIAATIYVLYTIPVPVQDMPSGTANMPSAKPWFSMGWKSITSIVGQVVGVSF